MTDVLELVERARPEVDPIDPAARRRFREELFHDGRRTPRATAHAAATVPWQTRHTARRLVVIVAVLLAGGLAALFLLRDDEPEATTETSAAASTSTNAPETTEPAAAEPAPVELPVSFDPVLLSAAPDGYQLHWARYTSDGVGLARYTSTTGGPDIAIFIRPVADLYSGTPPEDRQTWQVGGRTLIASPPGPCTESSCNVDVQWDDTTALSLSWVNWDGTPLAEEVDRTLLVDLAAGLTSQPETWEPGSIDSSDPSWAVPTAATAPLLVPGEQINVVANGHLAGPIGSTSLVVAAPDGSFISLQERDGPQLTLDGETVEQGQVTVSPPAGPDENPLLYELELTCGAAQIADVPGSPILRAEMATLLDSMVIDRGEIVIDLPSGWSRIDQGRTGDIFVVTFEADVGAGATEISLLQSPGGSEAALMFGGRQFEPARFAGAPAWREITSDGSVNIVTRRAGTAFEVRGRDITVEQLEAVLTTLEPTTTDLWAIRFGELQTTDVDTSCAQQPFFTVNGG